MTNTKMTDAQKALARKAFPEYRGRKFNARTVRSYAMSDFWDGGSRTYVKAVDLATGRIGAPSELCHNPMNGQAHAEFTIPPGVALIEHSVFMGKDCGLTFVTGPVSTLQGPVYDEIKGWTGGDDRTLYAITDKRTGRMMVRPGYQLTAGSEAEIRIATRAEAEAGWQSPLHSGWTVREAA